ncbi:hypothetical protein V6R21_15605 [Limibacter armeniacum]|uniref:hypothetical protein n=1 Tax=Limibacter armeniacum TaxID=466084 RepID=UPI002FE5FE44
MSNLEDLISKYVDEEDPSKLDKLFEKLHKEGSPEEKGILADGYLSHFSQCHYDYMCNKFNNLDWIWEMMDWIEKVKLLKPEFESYHYFKGHVYEMVSSVSTEHEEKVKNKKLCIEEFRAQQKIESEDVTLLTDLAENLFSYMQLVKKDEEQMLNEIKELYLEALHIERKEEHQSSFYGFNGTAINHFLRTSYQLLPLPIGNAKQFHQDYLSSFMEAIKPYIQQEPEILFHWAETLFRITEWEQYPKIPSCKISAETIESIWIEIVAVMDQMTEISSVDDLFLTSVGHLYDRLAQKEESIPYYQVSVKYFLKALKINGTSWTNPHYASSALQKIALIHLQNGQFETAKDLLTQGLDIFEAAQKKIDDFQLSIYHADYLYAYAGLIEQFNNRATLIKAQQQYEESRVMGKDFYTKPYYGLAKVALKLGNKSECLDTLKKCGEIFSNEYHTHDFSDIIDKNDFKEVREDILKIIEEINKQK